jgi:hypothetical protein
MATFNATPAPSPAPFSVGRKLTLEEWPRAYAWLAAQFLPEFDRQLTILGAAHTAFKLNAIWPFRTGRSVRSWEVGTNSVPEANNPPGPRPTFTVEEAERTLAGFRPGDEAFVANQARRPGAVSSYAQGLWSGAFSPQLRGGAERPLAQHLQAVSVGIVALAEKRAIGTA